MSSRHHHRFLSCIYRLADREELANNVQAEGKNCADKAEDERDELDEQAVDEDKDGLDEAADAVAERNSNEGIEQNLHVSNDAEDEAKSTEESLMED